MKQILWEFVSVLIGSAFIGVGASSWMVGIGVFILMCVIMQKFEELS